MSKTAKKVPWVPPPGQSKKLPSSKTKNLDPAPAKFSPNSTFQVQEGIVDSQKSDNDSELESLCSNYSICANNEEMKLYLQDIKLEQRLLNSYFSSLRLFSQFLNRDTNIKHSLLLELVLKIEKQLNSLMTSFEDLEFSLCSFENSTNEGKNSEEFSKILKLKRNILSKLMEYSYDILNVFKNSTEEYSKNYSEKLKNVQEKLEREQESLKCQLQAFENKNLTQASTIKDLEKRLSLLQAKNATLESYNTTLEETKAELQQILRYKDVQLKNINLESNEIFKNPNDERLIELIEEIKAKAHAEKTALKKALKVYKLQLQQKDQLLKKQETDISEKTQMLYELAAQRDKLKVQLTVSKNEIIETKILMEEMRCQKLKLQNELDETEKNYKNKFHKELDQLKNEIHEKDEKEHSLKMEIKKLNDELTSTINELEATKSSLNTKNQNEEKKNMEEVKALISVLEETKNYFTTIRQSDVHAKGDGIQIGENESILIMLKDIKEQMLEMKKINITEDCGDGHKNVLVKQMEELEKSHKVLLEENENLKKQIKDFKTHDVEAIPSFDNSVSAGYELSTENLKLDLRYKTEEIYRLKQREKKLEYQLEEVKDKLQKKEMENSKIFTLEESLKRTEEELRKSQNNLYLLEQKKHDETEKLLERTKELQEALEEKSASYDSLERFVDKLKSSFCNVFETS